jgi:hypothetical protein
MKRTALLAVFLVVLTCSWASGGLLLTVENDFFADSDDDYTHGTQMAWMEFPGSSALEDWSVLTYGLRGVMYTPNDYERTESPHPWERPYAGVTTAYFEAWRGEKLFGELERVRYGVEVGVLGPWSGEKEMQTVFHRWTGNRKPMGWGWQMPNEPVLNAYADRFRALLSAGREGGMGFRTDWVYGGVLGTTWIEPKAGVDLKAGWNMPVDLEGGVIGPKAERGMGWFGGLVANVSGWWQARNATLGGSFFRHGAARAEQERELEPWVWEWQAGAAAGWRDFSVTYRRALRSDEFKGQEKRMDWGSVMLSFGRTF